MVEFEQKPQYDIADLQEIVRLLRSPEGCPWDKEQTHTSIRNDFLEEAYEAVEAIDLLDMPLMREELGDLLFSCVNTARHLGIDAEEALTKATNKFIERFAGTEQLVTADGKNMPDLPIEELDVYWADAKQQDRQAIQKNEQKNTLEELS